MPESIEQRRRAAQRGVMHTHNLIYRLSGGAIGGQLFGAPVLLLGTIGRKTQQLRLTPLLYLPDGAQYVIVASYGGAPSDPTWFVNLQARPRALVYLKRNVVPVRAVIADAATRERLWPRLVDLYAPYADYQRRTARTIPVVVLQPD